MTTNLRLFAASLIAMLLTVTASAETYSGTCGDNVNWRLDTSSGMMEITGTGAMTDWNSTGDVPWSSYRGSIKRVYVRNGVTSIGSMAFQSCSNLTFVSINNSVTTIKNYAFLGTGLTSIDIPSGVTNFGYYVFSNCDNLSSITVYSDNTKYDSRDNCNAIIETATNTLIAGCKGTVIPSTVTSIRQMAFSSCKALTSITIPASVTSIGMDAFRYCESLASVTIGSSVTSYGTGVFNQCPALTDVVVYNPTPAAITEYVFSNRANAWLHVPNGSKSAYEAADYWKDFKGILEMPGGQCGDNLYWSLDTISQRLVITGSGAMYDFSSDGTPVPWKDFRESITSVSLPEGLTKIGARAFDSFSALTSATIPASVTSISDLSFIACSALRSLTVAAGNTAYDSRDNCNCIIRTNINTIVAGSNSSSIPESVTAIGYYAFYGRQRSSSYSIPSSVRSIGHQAFRNATITSIILPESVTSLGTYAFYNCKQLKSVTLPSNITSIPDDVFFGCSALEAITIPETVTAIGTYAFYKTGLKHICIPAGVTTIGNQAFGSCDSLTSVAAKNPTPVTITQNTFSNRANATLTVPVGSKSAYQAADYWKQFKMIGEGITFVDGAVKALCVQNWDTNGDGELSYAEAAAVTNLEQVFRNNRQITSFDELQYFTGLTGIDDYDFYYCDALTAVTLPAGLEWIGEKAFYYCRNLTSIAIPGSVTEICQDAFSGCNKLKKAEFTSLEHLCSISFSNVASNPLCYAKHLYINGAEVTEVVIPSSITEIGRSTFAGGAYLTSVTIHEGVTSIGDGAFYGCSGLTSINLPSSVRYIGGLAFGSCSGLTSINIPEGVEYIWDSTFSGCTGLTGITIPTSVKYIGQNAFSSCTGLTGITIPTSVKYIGQNAFYNCTGLTSINIPESVTEIGDAAFRYCIGLTTVTVPETVNTFGTYVFSGCINLTSAILSPGLTTVPASMFRGCTSLTSIKIPSSVTTIGQSAFDGCTALTGITLPDSVASIGSDVLYGCSQLNYVISESTDPMNITNRGVFHNIPATCALYVPFGTRETYLNKGWTEEVFKGGVFEGAPTLDYVALTDGEAYTGYDAMMNVDSLTYSRTYKNTNWQPWYVPFDMRLTSEMLSQFAFAKFAGTYTDEDGTFYITIVRLREGAKVKGNTPYFIQAKTADSNNPQVITVIGTKLYPAYSNSIVMHSAEMEITVTGIYQTKTVSEDDKGWYAYSGGKYSQQNKIGNKLNPFRFFVTIANREDNPYEDDELPGEVKIRLLDEDETTISPLPASPNRGGETIYDLQGRKVEKPSKGLYIVNGKKVLF